MAAQLAQVWLESNYAGYQQTGLMVEKYDATKAGLAGGGGEYTVQQGFGWTNGVMFKFLDSYGWTPSAGAPLPAADTAFACAACSGRFHFTSFSSQMPLEQ